MKKNKWLIISLNPKILLSQFFLTIQLFLFLLFTIGISTNAYSSNQQKKQISGIVIDASGEPLIGASIIEKGTTNGVVTDTDGNFTLLVEDDATIQVSYIGFLTQEVSTADRTYFNINLEEDILSLEEVIVIGYGTLDKKELTTSVTHIGEKDFLQIPTTNPIMQIQGKVAGVQIQRTGGSDPNAGESVQIRGAGSRVAGTGPLIVIDGIPGGDLKNIDNNDIESIDILKGGAAAAIYGSRAANGVIIVTTKGGAGIDQLNVDYNSYISTEMIKDKLEILSPEEFLELGISRDLGARTDWFNELTNNLPLSHSHSIALSSGSKKTQYRASVQFRDFDGIDIATSRKEYGGRINLHHKALDDILEFDLNVAPRFTEEGLTEYGAFYQAIHLNPTIPVFDPDKPGEYSFIVAHDTWNPVEQLAIEKREASRKYFTGSGKIKFNINNRLNTSVMYALESNERQYNFFSPSTSTNSKNNVRRGQASRQLSNSDNQVLDWLVNYIYDKRDFSLKFLGGYSYQYFHNSSFSATNYDFPSDALTYNDLGSGLYLKEGRAGMSSDRNSSTIVAFFGRANVSLLDRYFLSASVRQEGSSKFGEHNKWGFFPGISGGWILTEEQFLKNQNTFQELKLRADFGITGNQGFPSYQAQRLYGGAGNYFINGQWIQGFGPGNNYNPDLQWERSINFNVGLDFTMFKNRVNGSLEFYNRKSDGLLGQYDVAVPPNIHAQTWVNVGTIKNIGSELTLGVNAVNTKDFQYTFNLVGAYNKNWLVSFSKGIYEAGQVYLNTLPAPGSPGPTMLLEEGVEIGSWYMFKHAGIDENGFLLAYKKVNGEFTDEKQLIQGLEHDQKHFPGSAVPKVTGSMNHSFNYKNFDLNLFFRGAFGHLILNEKNMYFGLKAFEGANLLRKAYFPAKKGIQLHEVNDAKKISDFFLQKGDWVKLDIISLGYTFNNVPKLKNLRLYFSGKNMFLFTKYDGLDPELAPVNGLEPGRETQAYYPISRTITLGLQVSF